MRWRRVYVDYSALSASVSSGNAGRRINSRTPTTFAGQRECRRPTCFLTKTWRVARPVSGRFSAEEEAICHVGRRAFDLLICAGVGPVWNDAIYHQLVDDAYRGQHAAAAAATSTAMTVDFMAVIYYLIDVVTYHGTKKN